MSSTRQAVRAAVVAVAFGGMAAVAAAGPAKNLQIYPKDTDTKVVKDDMKKIAKALGVECDFCHDLDNGMDRDTDLKNKARSMMRMVATINGKLKKAGLTKQVTCMTCHQGNQKPKK